MIPTSVTGVFFFLVLLLPGFVFTLVRERHRPSRNFSAFRETSATVFASTIALLVLGLTLILTALFWPYFREIVLEAVSDPNAFVSTNRGWMGIALALYLVIAIALAAFFGSESWSKSARRVFKMTAPDPASSGWWILFEQLPNTEKILGITMDDGTWFSGKLYSWSRDAEDTPDRELTLSAPLYIRPSGSQSVKEVEDAQGFTVSARHIRYLTVNYVNKSAPEETST